MSDKDNMEKVAAQIPDMQDAAAAHLEKVAGQNVQLVKRAESAEHELRLMKMARRMEERHVLPDLSFDEKIAKLQEVPLDKLASMEQAIEMTAGGVRLGTVERADDGEPTKRASGTTGETYQRGPDGSDELESFIEAQEALS